MALLKDQAITEDSLFRDLSLSDGWKLALEPWIKTRIEAIKDEMSLGLDHDKYFAAVGGVQALKMVLVEVKRRAGRKSADIPD